MREHKGRYDRGYLPHIDAGGLWQFITFRTADSLPAGIARSAFDEDGEDEGDAAMIRFDAELDRHLGACPLRDPAAADLVINALHHFADVRYRLHAWVVMPNHVHVVISQRHGHPLADTVRSWKSYTGRKLGKGGRFWQPDYYDRYLRDDDHLRSTVAYVHANPVTAGLVDRPEDWPWSSAAPDRQQRT